MSVIDNLLAVIAPHECLGCGAEGSLLCRACGGGLPSIVSRCYRCRRLTAGHRSCPACHSRLYRVMVATHYDGLAKQLIWKLKYDGAQAAARDMALLLNERYRIDDSYLIVPVPTATHRVRQRGYDQATLLAKALARCSGARRRRLLVRTTQSHQVGASRTQRIRQLTGAFRVKSVGDVSGKAVLLVDDVLTTGATLEAAAAALRAAGARRVDALVFAQA